MLEHFLFSNPLHVAGLVAAQGRGAGSASRAPALAQLLHTLTDTLGAAAVEEMLTGESAVDAYNQTPLDVASTVKGGAPAAVLALLEGGDSYTWAGPALSSRPPTRSPLLRPPVR